MGFIYLATDTNKEKNQQSTLYLAIYYEHLEIARMLANLGAECTEREIEWLGERFTDFITSITAARSPVRTPPQAVRTSPQAIAGNTAGNWERERQILQTQLEEHIEALVRRNQEVEQATLELELLRSVVDDKETLIHQKDSIIQQQTEQLRQKQEEPEPGELPQKDDAVEAEEKRQLEQMEEEIGALKQLLEHKNVIIQQQATQLQEQQKKLEEKAPVVQTQDPTAQQHEPVVQQLRKQIQQLEKKLAIAQRQRERDHQMQILLSESQQNLAKQIMSLEDLQFVSKINHGCDAVVFNCSALHLGVPAVALKILFNLGVNTSQVHARFANEHEILQKLPFHMNIIPIWNSFLDRPTPQFFEHFPDGSKEYVKNPITGAMRSTTCILMPILEAFDKFFTREHRTLTVNNKLTFISDIISGLVFLFDKNVVHRDMKLNNLLINATGRIIITDFGCATKLDDQKTIFLRRGERIGGNPLHLAPEIKSFDTSISEGLIDYSKQPSFELGLLAFEIIFGDVPEPDKYGEQMDDGYFLAQCLDDSHRIPELFVWLRGLLMKDPQMRTDLYESAKQYDRILRKRQ